MAKIEKSIEIKISSPEIWPSISWGKVRAWMRIIKNSEYSFHEREGVSGVRRFSGTRLSFAKAEVNK